MLLAPIPWTLRIWELPFFAVMLPLERDYHQLSHRQQTLSDRARQTVGLVRHWLLEREPVGDGNTYVAIDWLDSVRHAACIITRLRFDTALYEATPTTTVLRERTPTQEVQAAAPSEKVLY
jgi:hypothetical protein